MKHLSRLYISLIFIFMYAPIAVFVFFSFNSTESTAVFTGFSLKWYEELFRNEATLKAFYNTIILAITSAVIATVFGTIAAVGISYIKKGPIRSVIMTITNIPMMNADIVTGISLMLLFSFVTTVLGLQDILGFGTLLIAHVTFNLPYVILSVLPRLKQLDPHLIEAAQDLGCTPIKAFFKVVIPSIMPGILSGLMMAFTLSIDDFVISYFVSGSEFQTLPLVIESMTKKRVTPDMYALSTIIFVTILVLLILINVTKSEGDSNKRRAGKR